MKAGIDFFWQYEVEVCNTLEDYKIETEEGLLIADNWTEAMERLIQYYGEDELTVIKYLEGYDFGRGIITKEDLDSIKWKE